MIACVRAWLGSKVDLVTRREGGGLLKLDMNRK